MGDQSSYKRKQQRLGLFAMYLDTLCMAIGFYMLIPLLSIYAIHNLNWSAATVGIILAISSLSQQGFRFLSGLLAERIGYKEAIVLGVGIRVVGYLMFGLMQFPIGFMLAAFIAGVGGSLFHPSSYAVYAILTEEKGRSKIYAIREMLSNLGFILGPVIGMLLLSIDFSIVCYTSAAMFVLAWILTYLYVPSFDRAESKSKYSLRSMLSKVIRDVPFIKFNIVILVIWSISVQLYFIVPIRAGQILMDVSNLAYLYTAAAVFMVLLQLPIHIVISKMINSWMMLAAGSFFIAMGYLIIGFSVSVWMLLIGILVFTLGQTFFIPKMNEMISSFANKQSFALYFGFSGFFLAIGGFMGNTITGFLQEFTFRNNFILGLPWIYNAIVGFSIVIFIIATSLIKKPNKP